MAPKVDDLREKALADDGYEVTEHTAGFFLVNKGDGHTRMLKTNSYPAALREACRILEAEETGQVL